MGKNERFHCYIKRTNKRCQHRKLSYATAQLGHKRGWSQERLAQVAKQVAGHSRLIPGGGKQKGVLVWRSDRQQHGQLIIRIIKDMNLKILRKKRWTYCWISCKIVADPIETHLRERHHRLYFGGQLTFVEGPQMPFQPIDWHAHIHAEMQKYVGTDANILKHIQNMNNANIYWNKFKYILEHKEQLHAWQK